MQIGDDLSTYIIKVISKTYGEMTVTLDEEGLRLYDSRSWNICKNRNNYYLTCNLKKYERGTKFFHRQLLKVTDSQVLVDHINHDGLDNRKTNLRLCNKFENARNARRKAINETSKYKGVTNIKTTANGKPYMARIKAGNGTLYLGCFKTEIEAAKAYNEKALELHGEFAFLNDVIEEP